MYRTKIYKELEERILLPILDFIGLGIDNSTPCGLLKWIGCCKKDKETGKVIPRFFTNPFNADKIYAIARTQDEFIYFKSKKDELEFFNPFIRYKNVLLLLLYTQPIVYERLCVEDEDDDENLAKLIVDDEIEYSQQELYRHVRIKQYPVTKDEFDNNYYKFSFEVIHKDNTISEVSASSTVKIVAVLMTIIKIMEILDESPEILDCFRGNYEDLQSYIEIMIEKYIKERELNRKDLKKVKIENEVEIFTDDDLELFETSSVEDLLNSDDGENSSDKEPEKVVNISSKYKNAIPIEIRNDEEDNRFLGLDFN